VARSIRIGIVGGGSFNWSPTIIRDTMLAEGLEGAEFRLLDINRQNADTVAALGRKLARDWGLPTTFVPTTNPDEALKDADFVVVTISTGGLAAMKFDLAIPERYGIFQTVGDTVGPGGWSRALRNVPVFVDLGRRIRALAPNAAILNYTNPLTVLTKTLSVVTDQPVVGLCHGLYEDYAMLRAVFGLESEEELKVNVGGLNHFFWILDLKIRGEDGYALLRHKMKKKSLADVIREAHDATKANFHRDALVASELFDIYGLLTYSADRHTSEFFGRYITPTEKRLAEYKIVRTSIAERRQGEKRRAKRMHDWISGKQPFPRQRSREAAADIIRAMALGREFIDVMNVPNRGQVPNLPEGAVLETLGLTSARGFTPLSVGCLPEPVAGLVARHATNQNLIVEAAMDGDREKALWVLINDPVCGHLSVPDIKAMADRLMQANRQHLPQFFGRGKRG
jgi:alpha-galactosidase/6-phospho-beta-glucosidase family protein